MVQEYKCKIRVKLIEIINQWPYPITITKKDTVENEVQRMIDFQIIERLKSPYSLPIVPVFLKKWWNAIMHRCQRT